MRHAQSVSSVAGLSAIKQHHSMWRTMIKSLACLPVLATLASCSPSTRVLLRNETGVDVTTQISGEAVRLSPGEASRPFILAWGPQQHWTKEIRGGGCAYRYLYDAYEQGLNLPKPALTRSPTILVLDQNFRLTATDADGVALGSVSAERRCS